MSTEFKTVTDQASLEEFFGQVHHLHDGLVREVSLLARGYVDGDLWMHGDTAPSDVRLVIHTQSAAAPYIEIILEHVTALSMDFRCVLHPHGCVDENEITLFLREKPYHDRFKICASTMKYRILGTEMLGKSPRTVQEIPVSDGYEY